MNSIVIFVVILILNYLFFNYIKSKIGRVTGDILWGGCEITEVVFYLV